MIKFQIHTSREARRCAVKATLGRILMPELVPRTRPAHGQRVAALRRTLIVTNVQRVRSTLFQFLLIVLHVLCQIGALRRVLQSLAGLRWWHRRLKQAGPVILIVFHAVIAFLNHMRACHLGALVLRFIAVCWRGIVLWWMNLRGTRLTCDQNKFRCLSVYRCLSMTIKSS